MPSTTEKQRSFMGAELARKRAGKKTQTGMSTQQLREFASSVKHAKGHGGGGGSPVKFIKREGSLETDQSAGRLA